MTAQDTRTKAEKWGLDRPDDLKRMYRRRKRAVGANQTTDPLRTPQNRKEILADFACGMSWRKVTEKFGCTREGLRKWLLSDAKFMEDYLKAREMDADFILDRIEDLSEEARTIECYPEGHEKAGEPLPFEKEKHSRIRTAIEGLKIVLEKRAPKKYGQLLKLADADGEKLTVTVTDYSQIAQQERPLIDHDAEEVAEEDGDA